MSGEAKRLDDSIKDDGNTPFQKRPKKNKKPYSGIQKLLWLIAGSEISALEKCPNEYNRHANIGLMILITSLFAAFTSFVAAHTFVKDGNWGVVAFAIMWAMVIFSMDRSMVNSIKKEPGKADRFNWGYFWPRLVLAIILSFFMSIPLDHIVFKDRIEYQIDKNNNLDWEKRRLSLTKGLGISSDSIALQREESKSDRLQTEIDAGCSACPDQGYNTNLNNANYIRTKTLPALQQQITAAQNQYNSHQFKLRLQQTPQGQPLLENRQVRADQRLISLRNQLSAAKSTRGQKQVEMNSYYSEANSICSTWLKDKRTQKAGADSLKKIVGDRLDTNNKKIINETDSLKSKLAAMKGFDTQFVTLFLMPDWGVQILKWLIFLALLVIEILPTYLKLKTPIGQYDWEMYRRDMETEIEVNAKIESAKTGIKDIESYRSKSEVDLNKKVIDKMVVIEEQLANQMLNEWESKARAQMKNDINNS